MRAQAFAFHLYFFPADDKHRHDEKLTLTNFIVCAISPCVLFLLSACVLFLQILDIELIPMELKAFLLDLNNSTIVVPLMLMLHWLWRSFKKWAFDGLILVFCLSSIVCIESFCHLARDQFASNVQHFLQTCQKNCLSVTLLFLWAQSRVYLEKISFRGIGRQFYAIKQTLTNVVVAAYFVFLFIM
jgi:hypothetical protein